LDRRLFLFHPISAWHSYLCGLMPHHTSAIPVMEQFYTVQGEGAFAGHPAYFIRLGGCDVGCVWCDVKESWDASKHPMWLVTDLVKNVQNSGAPLVVVTGGEPAMHNLLPLTQALKEIGVRTHIETSGTHPLTGVWDWITFSPKKFKEPLEEIYSQAHELKTIVYHSSDLEWSAAHGAKVNPNCLLFMQAEWGKREKMYPLILDYIRVQSKWRISVQTHKYIGVE
jgi:7-carboxy-7-deazaguanine synthase